MTTHRSNIFTVYTKTDCQTTSKRETCIELCRSFQPQKDPPIQIASRRNCAWHKIYLFLSCESQTQIIEDSFIFVRIFDELEKDGMKQEVHILRNELWVNWKSICYWWHSNARNIEWSNSKEIGCDIMMSSIKLLLSTRSTKEEQQYFLHF